MHGSVQPKARSTRDRRTLTIIRASWIGIVGNAALAILKLVVGVYAGSIAVVSDGVDSAMDVVTSLISLIAAMIMAKPPDLDHPYGHSRAETIATKTLSFIIFFAGAQLALSTVRDVVRGESHELPDAAALYVTIFSVLAKTGLSVYKFWTGKRANSQMLIADAKNMRGDIAVSLAVLASLGFVFWLDLPILDPITGIMISGWIMYVAFRIFLETNSELMEGFADTGMYREIFDAVESVPGAFNPHRTRIRKVGTHRIVDLDIEVDGDISVTEAHDIARQSEAAIRKSVPDVYDVLVHVEPIGNVERSERYGVSRGKLNLGDPDPGNAPDTRSPA